VCERERERDRERERETERERGIYLAREIVQWRTLLNSIMNHFSPIKDMEFIDWLQDCQLLKTGLCLMQLDTFKASKTVKVTGMSVEGSGCGVF
jgi:hypothetical protein